jgi:hypothetical protein
MKTHFGIFWKMPFFTVFCFFAFSGIGCGRYFKSEREAYSKAAYHVADSMKELSEATPITDPKKPGIEILKAETKAVAESLPVPEEKTG